MAVELKALIRILSDVRELRKATAETQRFHKRLMSVKTVLKGGLGIGAGFGAVNIIRRMTRMVSEMPEHIVRTNLEHEKTIQILGVAAKTQAGVLKLYEDSVKKADQYGQRIGTVASSQAKLLVASKGTALEGNAILEVWESLIATGTVLQLTADEMNGVFLATEQIISKNTVSAEELRQQLGERMLGAWQAAARGMGMTSEQLNKQISLGKIMAADLLPKLAKELDKTYGPQLGTAVASNQAKINRFHNEVELAWKAMGEAGFMDAFSDAISDVTQAIKDPEFQQAIKDIGKMMGDTLAVATKLGIIATKLATQGTRSGSATSLQFSAPGGFGVGNPNFNNAFRPVGNSPAPAGKAPNPVATVSQVTGPTTNLPTFTVEGINALGLAQENLSRILFKQKLLSTDTLTTEHEKRGQLLELLEQEMHMRSIIARERGMQAQDAELTLDEELHLYKDIQEQLLRIAEIRNDQTGQSFAGGFRESFVELADQSENVGGRIGDVFTGGINSAIASTSQSLGALIFQTGDFGQSFKLIAQNVIVSLIQIGLQEMVLAGIRSLMTKKNAAEVIAAESAKAPLLQANAAAASIGTGGAAAISGTTWALLGIGAITAALAFREKGGRYQAGQPTVVGEKRAELMIPDHSGYIYPRVDDPRAQARLASSSVGFHPGPSTAPAATAAAPNMAFFTDRPSAEDWLETQDGEGRIVEIMQQNRGEML